MRLLAVAYLPFPDHFLTICLPFPTIVRTRYELRTRCEGNHLGVAGFAPRAPGSCDSWCPDLGSSSPFCRRCSFCLTLDRASLRQRDDVFSADFKNQGFLSSDLMPEKKGCPEKIRETFRDRSLLTSRASRILASDVFSNILDDVIPLRSFGFHHALRASSKKMVHRSRHVIRSSFTRVRWMPGYPCPDARMPGCPDAWVRTPGRPDARMPGCHQEKEKLN